MKSELNLTIQKIFDKEFPIEFKGYSASEVDMFLDFIIQDYEKMENEIKELEQKNALMEQKNATLKSYVIELEGKLNSLKEKAPVSNTDILKRLSRLEEIIYQKEDK